MSAAVGAGWSSTRYGPVLRLAVVVALVAGALLAAAAPAAAHPALVSSEPGAGYAITTAPREIVLTFNEPVTAPSAAVVLRDGQDRVREVRVSQDAATGGEVLRAAPVQPLEAGAYEVAYRVIGQDGDTIVGTVAFGVATPVGAATTAGGSGAEPERAQPVTTLLRTLLFLGLALGLGGAYLAWRVDSATGGLPGVRPLLRSGALLGLAGALGLLTGIGSLAQLAATISAGGIGRLLGLQALLLALAAATARRPARGGVAAGLLVLVAVLEGARAHLYQASGLSGAALTVTHLLAGALWLGGLVHVRPDGAGHARDGDLRVRRRGAEPLPADRPGVPGGAAVDRRRRHRRGPRDAGRGAHAVVRPPGAGLPLRPAPGRRRPHRLGADRHAEPRPDPGVRLPVRRRCARRPHAGTRRWPRSLTPRPAP